MTTQIDQPTGPRTGRPTFRRLLLAAAVVLLLASLGSIGWCRKAAAGSRTRSGNRHQVDKGEAAEPRPIAHQPLALARYRMLKYIERQIGFFPLYWSELGSAHLYFPRGRSDKAYSVLLGDWPRVPASGAGGAQVLCFESRDGNAKLSYSVGLRRVYFRPPRSRTRVTSMLDHIGAVGNGRHRDRSLNGGRPETFSLVLSGPVSDRVRRDLSSRQELIDYTFDHFSQAVQMECLSCPESDLPPYPVYENRQDQWFAVYGLPLADCELPQKSKRRP
jgi:hypothetical protein